jgi:hypothetical protein
MERQNPSLRDLEASSHRLEMVGKDFSLANSPIGEEPVSGLCAGPVLAGEGNGLAYCLRKLFQ